MEVNGSETSSGSSGMMLTYDPFTMMTMREVKGSRILDSQYDGRKERVLKIDNINGTVTKTLYLHGLNDFPIMQKSSAGDERLYVCGLSGLVATRVNANWYYVHKDHLGFYTACNKLKLVRLVFGLPRWRKARNPQLL